MLATGQRCVVPAVAGDWLALLFYGSCFAFALLMAALIIELVRRWSRKEPETATPADQLTQYRALYKRGEISQEEFDRLRAVLGGEVVKFPKAQAAPTSPPAETPPAETPPAADAARPE